MGFWSWLRGSKAVKGTIAASVLFGALHLLNRDVAVFGKLEKETRPARILERDLNNVARKADLEQLELPLKLVNEIKAAIQEVHLILTKANHQKTEGDAHLDRGEYSAAAVCYLGAKDTLGSARGKMNQLGTARGRLAHIGIEKINELDLTNIFAKFEKTLGDYEQKVAIDMARCRHKAN